MVNFQFYWAVSFLKFESQYSYFQWLVVPSSETIIDNLPDTHCKVFWVIFIMLYGSQFFWTQDRTHKFGRESKTPTQSAIK